MGLMSQTAVDGPPAARQSTGSTGGARMRRERTVDQVLNTPEPAVCSVLADFRVHAPEECVVVSALQACKICLRPCYVR